MQITVLNIRPAQPQGGALVATADIRLHDEIDIVDLPVIKNRLGIFVYWGIERKSKPGPALRLVKSRYQIEIDKKISRAYRDQFPGKV